MFMRYSDIIFLQAVMWVLNIGIVKYFINLYQVQFYTIYASSWPQT